MNNKHYKIIVFLLLAIVVGAFTHCVQNSPIGGSSLSSNKSRGPSGSTPEPTPEQVLNQAQVEVGLKNFEQINYTFEALTGIPVASVAATYNAVEATLPSENEVKILQSSNQVAITRLAAEYCAQLANNGAQRDRVFGAGVFNQLPNAVNKMTLIENMTNAFWGSDVIEDVELAAARDHLLDLYNDIYMMETVNRDSTATTSKVIRAVCTAALSSAYVTIM